MASRLYCGVTAMMAFSSIGVLVGLSAGVVFAISFENYNASVWGVMSALAAALVLYIKTAELKDWYSGRPQLLRVFMYCGCFLQLIGVTGFVAYITLAIDHHQGLTIHGPCYYIASVWTFITWKWGFQLFYFSRSYWRRLSHCDTKLISED